MRYHEFGTRCPGRALGFKNPPSINVFVMADGHFALSEGAAPVLIDPDTLECRGASILPASWPARTTFTAHPKRDPVTGDVFAYGLTMALFPELLLARLPAGGQAFTPFARMRLGGFYPVHDFMLTETYVVVALPPVRINMWGMLRGRSCVADNIVAEPHKPLRIIVARKDGRGSPITIESHPANMIFHHCNAVESEDGRTIRLVSMETDAAEGFRLLEGWGGAAGLAQPKSQMTEFVIDIEARTVSRTALTEGGPIEIPAIDNRQLGRRMDTIYALRTFDAPGRSACLRYAHGVGWQALSRGAVRDEARFSASPSCSSTAPAAPGSPISATTPTATRPFSTSATRANFDSSGARGSAFASRSAFTGTSFPT